MPGEAGAAQKASVEQGLESFPDTRVQTRQQWIDKEDEEISQFLLLLYVLLALSVVISLFGMVNTLALSVFERTRELGMLRAVGMTRRQTRRMVRHESVITALIGAALGLPLGIFLAAAGHAGAGGVRPAVRDTGGRADHVRDRLDRRGHRRRDPAGPARRPPARARGAPVRVVRPNRSTPARVPLGAAPLTAAPRMSHEAEAHNARAFWLRAPGHGEIRPVHLAEPGRGDVVVRTLRTGISRGTETLVFRGGVPPSQHAAMRAPFQDGEFPGPVKYGYLNVGAVEHGPPELRGRTVFCLYPHQTAYVVPAAP